MPVAIFCNSSWAATFLEYKVVVVVVVVIIIIIVVVKIVFIITINIIIFIKDTPRFRFRTLNVEAHPLSWRHGGLVRRFRRVFSRFNCHDII